MGVSYVTRVGGNRVIAQLSEDMTSLVPGTVRDIQMLAEDQDPGDEPEDEEATTPESDKNSPSQKESSAQGGLAVTGTGAILWVGLATGILLLGLSLRRICRRRLA